MADEIVTPMRRKTRTVREDGTRRKADDLELEAACHLECREDIENVDKALDNQVGVILEAVSILRLAGNALALEPLGKSSRVIVDAGNAIDGALKLLASVVDRLADTETLLTLGNFT
jgi:hypothetical protein